MNVAYYLVIVLHVVACLFLIGVVLLQQGKNQDAQQTANAIILRCSFHRVASSSCNCFSRVSMAR